MEPFGAFETDRRHASKGRAEDASRRSARRVSAGGCSEKCRLNRAGREASGGVQALDKRMEPVGAFDADGRQAPKGRGEDAGGGSARRVSAGGCSEKSRLNRGGREESGGQQAFDKKIGGRRSLRIPAGVMLGKAGAKMRAVVRREGYPPVAVQKPAEVVQKKSA